jgi:hypothetical protein
LAACAVTASASSQSSTKVYGIGPEVCSQWLTPTIPPGGEPVTGYLNTQTRPLVTIAWMTGYVTAAAAVAAEHGVTLRTTTGKEIDAWLRKHCQANPAATINAAGAALVRELRTK